jgi:DNA-binding CsgD family transcriptional regulator
MMLTELASLQGQGPDSSIPTLEELLANARALGDVRGEGWVIARLSNKAMRRHDDAQALLWITEGLELGRRTGLWDAAGFAIVILAEVAFAQGDDAAVARLHGSVGRIMPMLPISIGPVHMAAYREMIQTVQERSGAATFDRLAHAAGRLSWDDATLAALDYAHRLAGGLPEMAPTSAPDAAAVEGIDATPIEGIDSGLTKRERDVLELLATGATNNEIAETLGLSTKTVMHHSVSIYAKLNVRGRAEATAWAFRHGIVTGAASDS